MASGSVPERLLEWYEANPSSGSGRGGASSRSGGSRNANLARAERVARSGGNSRQVREALYDLPF